jgi:hypothetical protein
MQTPVTVGRHFSYQVIAALCRTLPSVWFELSRDEHRRDSTSLVTESVERIRQSPLLQMCREVRDETGEPLNEAHQATTRLTRYFSRQENLAALPKAYCATATEIACAIEMLRQAAKLETDSQTQKLLDIGFCTMKRHLSTLLGIGLLAELPVSATITAPSNELLYRVAAVLYERRQVFRKASFDQKFEPWIRVDLAETMGNRLFDSARAQERHRAEICIDGLARHLGRPHPRFRRSLYADLALGIHEVFEVACSHARAICKAPQGSPLRTRRRNAALVSWITVVETLRTGLLLQAAEAQ